MDSTIVIIGCFIFALSLITPAHSATTVPFPTRGLVNKNMGAFLNDGVITYPATFETRSQTPATANTPSQAITRYTKRNVPLNKATAAKMAKGALAAGTGPVGLAISVGLIAASYLIDEETGEITTPSTILDNETAPSGKVFCLISVVNQRCSTTRTGALHKVAAQMSISPTPPCVTILSTSSGGGYGQARIQFPDNGQCIGGYGAANFLVVNPPSGFTPDAPITESGRLITDDELLSSIPNLTVDDLIQDSIDSGRWPEEWNDIKEIADLINRSMENDLEGTTHVEVDNSVKNSATNAVPQQQTQTGNESEPFELPEFCSWASMLCDWLYDDTQAPEVPEVPTTEVEPVEWSSGLGSGSCPANPTTEYSGQTIEYDLTEACWAASNVFKPILLALSLITAGFIVVGGRQT